MASYDNEDPTLRLPILTDWDGKGDDIEPPEVEEIKGQDTEPLVVKEIKGHMVELMKGQDTEPYVVEVIKGQDSMPFYRPAARHGGRVPWLIQSSDDRRDRRLLRLNLFSPKGSHHSLLLPPRPYTTQYCLGTFLEGCWLIFARTQTCQCCGRHGCQLSLVSPHGNDGLRLPPIQTGFTPATPPCVGLAQITRWREQPRDKLTFHVVAAVPYSCSLFYILGPGRGKYGFKWREQQHVWPEDQPITLEQMVPVGINRLYGLTDKGLLAMIQFVPNDEDSNAYPVATLFEGCRIVTDRAREHICLVDSLEFKDRRQLLAAVVACPDRRRESAGTAPLRLLRLDFENMEWVAMARPPEDHVLFLAPNGSIARPAAIHGAASGGRVYVAPGSRGKKKSGCCFCSGRTAGWFRDAPKSFTRRYFCILRYA